MFWRAVKIGDLDTNGVLAFDLVHILNLFESSVIRSTWSIDDVWAMGELAGELNRLGESPGEPVTGRELLRLATGVLQVIDGTFDAFWDWKAETRWLRIMAVDSTYYLVATDDSGLVNDIRSHFQNVEDVDLDWLF